MNVVKENLENQVALVKVTVSEADYSEAVSKQLKAYKKKANVPGFRPGMVPMSLIEKMYKKGVTAEEAYRTASKSVYEYIESNKLNTLGDPMPSDSQKELDFENETEYEFSFELGLAPEIALDYSKINLKKYVVEPTQELINGFKDNQLRRFGKLVDKEVVTSDEALEVTLDNEDMAIESAYVGLISMSEEERAPFIGKELGFTMDVDINELYKSPSQRASILSVKEEELEGINPKFSLRITRIRKFENPELNEEFFKEAFPAGDVASVEQFDEYILNAINQNLASESNVKMVMDGRTAILESGEFALPDAFMKKWLLAINEGKFTAEDIEKEYDLFATHTKWSLICGALATEGGFEVTEDEAKAEARNLAAMQFAHYGIATPTDEMLDNYTNSILQNKEEARRIVDSIIAKKCVEYAATKANIEEVKISYDEFVAMATAEQQAAE